MYVPGLKLFMKNVQISPLNPRFLLRRRRYTSRLAGTRAYILITSSQTPALTETIEESRLLGNEVLCIYAGELNL